MAWRFLYYSCGWYARDEARVVDELVGRWRTSEQGLVMRTLVTQLGDGSFPELAAGRLKRVEDVYDALAARKGGGAQRLARVSASGEPVESNGSSDDSEMHLLAPEQSARPAQAPDRG